MYVFLLDLKPDFFLMYTYLLAVPDGVWLLYLLKISIPKVFTVKHLASDWTFVTKWSFEAKQISNGPTFR